MKIQSVQARLFNVPLPFVMADAKHGDHHFFQLVTATVTLEDGSTGTGYTYTGGKGGHAIAAMITHDMAPALVGADGTDIAARYDQMEWHLHYVARGGIASFAVSAVDIALWDLKGKREARPLWQMAGGAGKTCRAYRGLPRYGPAHAVRARKQVRIVAVILDVVIKTKFVGETLQQLPAPTFGD